LNTKQAKDFLVEQTVEQAALDSVSLADIEKRMTDFRGGKRYAVSGNIHIVEVGCGLKTHSGRGGDL
jgi:hypothetical protein